MKRYEYCIEWVEARSATRSKMGRCFRGEVATGGWDHLERADERRIQRAIIDPSEFSGCGGRVKEKSLREINPLEKRADRWRHKGRG